MGNYKGFTCAKDVLIYLEMCEEDQKKTFSRLDKMDIGFFDSKELKQKRNDLKKQLRIIKFRIENCVGILEKNTTFNRRLFLNFLVKYLTLREGVEYAVMTVTEDDVALGIATKTYGCMSTEYEIITTTDNKSKLESKGDQGTFGATTDDINDYLKVCKDKKYLCFSEEETQFTLLRGSSLSKEFAKYPYFRNLAFDLVDLKMQNPNMSDEERLKAILNSVQKKMTYPTNK